MHTYPVTYFKNHALRILADVSTTGDHVLVTKHGKPLARIVPVRPEQATVTLGKLKGAMTVVGDIVSPLGDEDWEACR